MRRHVKKDERVRWRMREERTKRGLTLRQVAKKTNYSYGTIARAEMGNLYVGTKKDIRRDGFWKIMSDFYGVPKEELMKMGDKNEWAKE